MQDRRQRVAALAEERAPARGDPVLVRLGVRPAVRLLALHAQDRPASGIEQPLGLHERWRVQPVLRVTEVAPRFVGRREHRVGRSQRFGLHRGGGHLLPPREAAGERLLDDHVLARSQRLDGERRVQVVRHPEVDDGHRGIGQQRAEVGVSNIEAELGRELLRPFRMRGRDAPHGHGNTGDLTPPRDVQPRDEPGAHDPDDNLGGGGFGARRDLGHSPSLADGVASRLAGHAASRGAERIRAQSARLLRGRARERRRPRSTWARGSGARRACRRAYLITTGAGRIVVNTGMWFEARTHKRNYDAVTAAPDALHRPDPEPHRPHRRCRHVPRRRARSSSRSRTSPRARPTTSASTASGSGARSRSSPT